MKQTTVIFFARTAAVFLYCFLGAKIFVHFENQNVSNENETMSALNELRNKYNCRLKNITNGDLEVLAKEILDLLTGKKEWTTADGLQLTFEILTTIGKSNLFFTITYQRHLA